MGGPGSRIWRAHLSRHRPEVRPYAAVRRYELQFSGTQRAEAGISSAGNAIFRVRPIMRMRATLYFVT